MSLGFWEPGGRIYRTALANAAAEQLAELTRQLHVAATAAEKEQIEKQMIDVQAAFQQRCDDARYSLF